MDRRTSRKLQPRGRRPARRAGALTALLLMPVAAYGLGRLAWAQAQVVLDSQQLTTGTGPSTLSLGEALSPLAAGLGALVAAHLTWTAVVMVAAPRQSRVRAAVAAMTPATWRTIVSVATTGTLSVALAFPAAASVDAIPAGSTDAGWVTTPAAATATVEPASPSPSPPVAPDAAPAATKAASEEQPSSDTSDPEPAQAGSHVVVSPGDTLWDITASQLGISQNDHGAIAAAWPDLYDENRDTIGADPDVIAPGQHLTIPAGWTA